MTIQGKEYQRRWKEKQKARNKRQVTVMLSDRAYGGLRKMREATGDNFSIIMDRTILDLSNATNFQEANQGEGLYNDAPEVRISSRESLAENEENLQSILNASRDVIWRFDIMKSKIDYISPSMKTLLGYSAEEYKQLTIEELRDYIHNDDFEMGNRIISLHKTEHPKDLDSPLEYRLKHSKLGYRWMSTSCTVLYDKKNEPVAIIGNTRDIHRRKQAELTLQKLHSELEEKVIERTDSLKKANTALTLMLKKEQELKTELEEKILANLKELVLPYMEKLKITRLDVRQNKYLGMVELNLSKIVSPFLRKLSSKFLGLTPTEVQVSDLIRHGKTSKDIAELLNLSIRTIEFHRANIRRKIGIKNKRTSLRSRLMSFE